MFDNVSKMSKLEKVSYEMLVFLNPRVLSRVSGFPVASPRLWGKLGKCSRGMFQTMKIGESLVRNARFSASTCLVSSRWISCGVAVSMGKAPHSSLHTLHSTPLTLHSTLYTPHSTLYTLHPTLHTFYILHSTLYTP